MRLDHESELVLASFYKVKSIAEGGMWQDVRGEIRLPAPFLKAEHAGLSSFATGCAAIPLTQESLTQEDGPQLYGALHEEKKVGMKLVSPEKRTGKEHCELLPNKEIVPDGWVRNGGIFERV
jgi:hypothetical protein